MKLQHLLILLTACLMAFSACQQSAEKKPDMAQIKSEIQATEDAWATAVNEKDIEAIMSMYTDDAVSMPPGEPTLSGKAAIRKSQERDFANRPEGMTFSFEAIDVYGDAERVTEVGTSTYKNAEGEVTGTGKYIVVWEKQDDKYLCAREIYNEDQAPAPVATKSIHLFDLPDGITEAEFSASLQEMNEVVAELGYPGFGYHFYNTKDPDTEGYRYYFEGKWPSEEAYAEIHEAPAYKTAGEKLGPLYEKIKEVEIYRRVHLVK